MGFLRKICEENRLPRENFLRKNDFEKFSSRKVLSSSQLIMNMIEVCITDSFPQSPAFKYLISTLLFSQIIQQKFGRELVLPGRKIDHDHPPKVRVLTMTPQAPNEKGTKGVQHDVGPKVTGHLLVNAQNPKTPKPLNRLLKKSHMCKFNIMIT